MKKEEINNIINSCLNTYDICKINFKYSNYSVYYYLIDQSDQLFYSLEEDDFITDGFEIRQKKDIKYIEKQDSVCSLINKENQILKNINIPKININSWKDAFYSLQKLNKIIIVENETKNEKKSDFAIGKIINVDNDYIEFKAFSADGKWWDGTVHIPYKYITTVIFNSRYCNEWEKYLNKEQNKE